MASHVCLFYALTREMWFSDRKDLVTSLEDCARNSNGEKAWLFNRNRLGQVARLIHVASAPHGDVVGQQL
jgi:hypothetical protein